MGTVNFIWFSSYSKNPQYHVIIYLFIIDILRMNLKILNSLIPYFFLEFNGHHLKLAINVLCLFLLDKSTQTSNLIAINVSLLSFKSTFFNLGTVTLILTLSPYSKNPRYQFSFMGDIFKANKHWTWIF